MNLNLGISAHPSPIYSIEVDGVDITTTLAGRLSSLTLTDNRGFYADQLDIVLDDSDGKLALPPRGASIRLALGWRETGLIDKGTYTVDEIECSGTPDTLTIRARSADLRGGLTTQHERSFHGKTVGEIVREIASENEDGGEPLEALISATLDSQVIEHIDQLKESSISFLTRLADMFDATATVKNGKLLFIHTGGGVTASGTPLPTVTITRQDGDQHHFMIADRGNYTHVMASWNDIGTGKKGEAIWGAADDSAERSSTPKVAIASGVENTKTLRHIYAGEESAKRAARANWRRLQRGMAEFSLTLALGRPELFPEMPAIVQGFKRELDSTDWTIIRATHSLSDAGMTTKLEFEIKATEIPG